MIKSLVSVNIPTIGMHGLIAWSKPELLMVETENGTQEEILGKINPLLPKEDPEVKKALKKQNNRDEYFNIKIEQMTGENGVYLIKHAG